MANRRETLPRLSMPAPPMYAPPFLQQSALQTPMQALFNSQVPAAPARPIHHAHQASIQLAAAGIHPPNLVTPVSTHFPRPSMILGSTGQPPSHPFPNRSRRQLSIGGPPKAVLGGPARKLSPLPSTSAPTAPATTPQKTKKVFVNLPKETVPAKDGEPATRPSWARSPLDNPFQYQDDSVIPAELTTAELFPPDTYRLLLPHSIDVYLPGKIAWDDLKKRAIEDKLEKLGVECGSGSNLPHIHAPHARAASVSSPADPALLLFKLNKLQQSRETSPALNNSLSLSPNPLYAPFGLSPSPHRGPRFMTNRHGHTMSLAQPPSYQSSLFSPSPSLYNPLGGATVPVSESSMDSEASPPDPIHAPQGRVPMAAPSFAPPLSAVGGNKTHIDFIRGFGLETPMESEEETEPEKVEPEVEVQNNILQETDLEENYVDEAEDDSTTAPHSRLHSRHASRISATLSLRSVGGNFTQFRDAPEEEAETVQEPGEASRQHVVLDDEVEEWTGSEDVYLGIDTSEDESIGEWSNPSDEERARQQRVERRMRRERRQLDQPRRLPNFPLPPDNTLAFYPHAGTDDDLISNPSEENMVLARRAEFLGVSTEQYYGSSTSNMDPESPRLMHRSPLPHSRVASGHYSVHDPAMAHSRGTSENFIYPSLGYHQSQPSTGRRDSLNPLAKPFVFGAARTSGSFQPFSAQSSAPPNLSASHSRLPSIGKPLNVAAPEFKPGEFNFRLPSGAPHMPVPVPEFPRPQLAEVSESAQSSPFKIQGREKRQRRGSSASMEEGDSMSSFRFPMKSESPHSIRRAGSFSGIPRSLQDDSAPPFTFAGFSAVANNMPLVPKESGNISMPEPELATLEDLMNDSSTAEANNSGVTTEGVVVIPQVTKTKRAPIPLDFKHPGSGNTVPAGLFKALVNSGEDRTRRTVRSRLNSHETFEHLHRPSMDDDNVPLIAQKNPAGRLVTDPGPWKSSKKDDDDVFGGSVRHARRRSSLPDALHDDRSSVDEASIGPQDLTTRMELHRVETVIAELLDEKLAPIRRDLAKREQNGEKGLSASTEAMMADVISLFRTQLHESATSSLDDSQRDARGDLDFQMIKDVVEEGHKGLLSAMQHELHRIIPADKHNPREILSSVEQIGTRTVNAVIESISELAARQEAISQNAPARERDIIVDKLVAVLSPMMHSLHNEPIDYEQLTRQLTQAVKPHISQLIDLASDKRETASLIVDRILPLLPSMGNPPIDTDALTLKLITEVRRAIAPIDAFEIKEHVADLVVERLDSRLAVRDKAFNVDIVTARVTESVSQLLEALNTVPSTLSEVMSLQKAVNDQQSGFTTLQSGLVASISDIPSQIGSQFETLKNAQDNILRKLDQPLSVAEPDVNVIFIKDLVETMAVHQKDLVGQNGDISSQTKHLSEKLGALPGTFTAIANNIQITLTELITSRDNSRREMEELRKLNTDYQIQLTKARGSHGQVRVEKDVLSEKLTIVEEDRERLRVQVKELQAGVSSKTAEMSTLESRNVDLEEALAKALARLQSSDVAAQAHQESIAELEKANVELVAEKQDLKSKVNSLELEVAFAAREKETASKAFETLQKQHDGLALQQSNWDAITTATEKINMVYKLLENADDEEQKELRHHRDRSKALESENVALQKRFKELEAKVANSDRAATTMRQSLTQAQQRSTEWERRAKDYESQLEVVQTKLDQAEQTQGQLEADLSMLKVQVEEQEADSRLSQDRETRLCNQITALESKCTLLQSELEKARSTKVPTATATSYRPQMNGTSHPPPRPDSRASTIYDGRGDSRRVSSYSTTTGRSPQPSVWNSMHAPPANTNGQGKWNSMPMHTPSRFANVPPSTPKPHHKPYPQYPRGPSPTPSTVSAVPTQGDDGWWS